MINLAAFDPFAWTVMAVLMVLMPLTGLKEFDLLARWVHKGRLDARVRFYNWLMAMEWVLTLSLLAWWMALDRGARGLGLLPIVAESWQWIGVVVGLALTFMVFMQMNMVLASNEHLRKVRRSLGRLRNLAPRDSREQAAFLQVSLTAGICEEILYRGFLMHVFTEAVGMWPALVLVAVVFGLGHAYQGWEGILKTGLVGLLFGGLALASGSLLVVMVLHAVLDLTSGRIMQGAVHLPPENLLERDN